MLLQLPLELQRPIVGKLSLRQALSLREVSRECRDLASASIRSVTLSSVAEIKNVGISFPALTHLSLKPETEEDRVLLDSAFHPEQEFAFPPTLTRLDVDTRAAVYDVFRCCELADSVAACPVLHDIQLAAYYVDLKADDSFLQKLVGLKAEALVLPSYPPRCFLSSGVISPWNLPRCTNLKSLTTYTRSNEDTDDLMCQLAGNRSLQELCLTVPCVGSTMTAATDLANVTDLKLIGDSAIDEFRFDMSEFPRLEFLVVSLRSICPEPAAPTTDMRHLTSVWLNNVTNILALRHAPSLTTLSLNYTQFVFTNMQPSCQGLSTIPNLRRLEIRNLDVDPDCIVACPRLQEVVLVDVIALPDFAPSLYVAYLVAAPALRSLWLSSEANGYLFSTEQFEFDSTEWPRAEWRGRICKTTKPQEWFGEVPGSDQWRLGLELTRVPNDRCQMTHLLPDDLRPA